MLKKKIWIFMIIVCLIGAFAVRVYVVNRNVNLPTKQEFSKGEIVPFGDDFSDDAKDAAPGYTLQVLDSKLLPINDFIEAYDSDHEIAVDGFTEYFYVVKVSIENVDNQTGTESGISLDLLPLVGTNYFILIDDMAFESLNPDMPGSSFSLQPGTSKEILIPYAINTEVHAGYNQLQKDPPKLQLTEYPHCKLAALN